MNWVRDEQPRTSKKHVVLDFSLHTASRRPGRGRPPFHSLLGVGSRAQAVAPSGKLVTRAGYVLFTLDHVNYTRQRKNFHIFLTQ